jgi:hypothetical protein
MSLYQCIGSPPRKQVLATIFQFKNWAWRKVGFSDEWLQGGFCLLTTEDPHPKLPSQKEEDYTKTQLLSDLRIPSLCIVDNWQFPELPFKHLAPKMPEPKYVFPQFKADLRLTL